MRIILLLLCVAVLGGCSSKEVATDVADNGLWIGKQIMNHKNIMSLVN